MTIRKVWGSRVNQANAETFVGQKGTLFFNEPTAGGDIGLRISDGITTGGVPISLSPATTSTIGGIRVGPGINVGTGGLLTIDTAGLPLSFGDFYAVSNTLSTVNANEDAIIMSNGTGTVKIVGEFGLYATSLNTSTTWQNNLVLSVSRSGFTQINVPTIAVGSVGFLLNGDNGPNPPGPTVSGGMLQVVGNTNVSSRVYNDAYGVSGSTNAVPTWISRAARGTPATPSPTLSGDKIGRFSCNGWGGSGFVISSKGVAPTAIEFIATENFTPTASGTRIAFTTVATGTVESIESGSFNPQGLSFSTTGTGITFTDGSRQLIAFNTQSAVTSLTTGTGLLVSQSNGNVTISLNTNTIVANVSTGYGLLTSQNVGNIVLSVNTTSVVTALSTGSGMLVSQSSGSVVVSINTNAVVTSITTGTGIIASRSVGGVTLSLNPSAIVSSITTGTGILVSQSTGSVVVSLNPSSVISTVNAGYGIISVPTTGTVALSISTTSIVTSLSTGTGIFVSQSTGSVAVSLNTNTIMASAHTVIDAAQPTIKTVGTLTNLSVGGTIGYDITQNNGTASGFNKSGGVVTVNARSGQLTTAADSLAKGAYGLFTVTNSFISGNDVVILNKVVGGTPLSYEYWVSVTNGSFQVMVYNGGAGPLAESLSFNFAILKVA